MRPALALLVLAVGCDVQRSGENWQTWYDAGSELDVAEPIAFTDVNYDFTGPSPIADIPTPDDFETWFAPDDEPVDGCPQWRTMDALPLEIEGVVTLHPRKYIKLGGCGRDSDERYYGSYFVQDRTGGYFVLNESKVAPFDMGARVRMRVRAVREYFGQTMIAAHDVLEVDHGPQPIYYDAVRDRLLDASDISRNVRVEGVVGAPRGSFGEIYLCTGDSPDLDVRMIDGDPVPDCYLDRSAEAPAFKVSLDQELQGRGIDLPVGTRWRVTGPVQFSFDEYQLNVLRVGQLERLSD